VFTLGLIWDSATPSREQITSTLAHLDTEIDLSKVLHGVAESPANATLCCLICFYSAHYCAIVHDDRSNTWLHFDDSSVSVVGSTWLDVRSKCLSSKYQPVLVLYRRVPLCAPAEDDANAHGASWANMAAARARATADAARPKLTSANRSVRPAKPPTDAFAKRGPGACHNCDDPAHESRMCPKPCRECGSERHRIGYHYRAGSKPAPNSKPNAFRAGAEKSKCFNCDEIGHESRECTKPCGICKSTQHKSGYHLNDHLYEGKADRRKGANGKAAAAPAAVRGKPPAAA